MAKKHKKKTLFRILLSTIAIGSIFLASNSKKDYSDANDSKDKYNENSIDDEFIDECNA
ncbi:hypothetical protein NRP93_001944 [Clostridium botulinum]|nr:hypothetical protein [Clostridium botulinum]